MNYFPIKTCFKKNIVFIFFLLLSATTSAESLVDNVLVEMFVNNTTPEERFSMLLDSIKTDEEALDVYQNIEYQETQMLGALSNTYFMYDIHPKHKRFFSDSGVIENSEKEKAISILFNLFNISYRPHPLYNEMAAKILSVIMTSKQRKALLRTTRKLTIELHKNKFYYY